MPPEEETQPPQVQIDTITNWIDDALAWCDCSGPVNPGRVTLHRLNRSEYNHTVRDLVGVNFQPADDFPADDTGYGFDNIADVLTMSPLLTEKYLTAAERIFAQALRTQPPPQSIRSGIPSRVLDLSSHHSRTLPCMSYRSSEFGG